MTKTIKTYEELILEKRRLQSLLQAQKELIHADMNEIKSELAPLSSAIKFAGKLTTRESGNWLLNTTANTIIDLVVKKLVLSRAGWITRLAVPFLLKNYSSHVIDENKESIINKIVSWLSPGNKEEEGKVTANGQLHEEEED